MKKCLSVKLTVVAAMGLVAARGQAPATPEDPNNCDEIRKAGAPVPQNCLATSHHGFLGMHRGGFGSTAKGHNGGG
jgi:hypothetical protein